MSDFAGARVLSLESRKAEAMEQLIRRHGGDPFVAPSVKEAPFDRHDEVYRWATRLAANQFNLVVFMTGTGLVFLRDIVHALLPPPTFTEVLRKATIVARGPKPAAILHEMGVTPAVITPEPNTWREIVPLIAARPERRITIQEYGRPNPAFAAALERLGAEVTTLAIYRWALPDDLDRLREAVRRIARR